MKISVKISKKFIITVSVLLLAALAPYFVFLCRTPVLIVTDMAFLPFYGEDRIQKEMRQAAFSLFRPVKMVLISDEADAGIVPYAIMDAHARPYSIIFPLRFADSARLYKELKPAVNIIILEGRLSGGSGLNSSDYNIYYTDVSADFYRAGLVSAVLCNNNTGIYNGRIVVFMEPELQSLGREAFLSGVNLAKNPPETSFFTSYYQNQEISDILCAVIAGTGIEFIENNYGIPFVLFSWLSLEYIPKEAQAVFNDSPFALAAQAVKMARQGVREGPIPSKLIINNPKKLSIRALRRLQK